MFELPTIPAEIPRAINTRMLPAPIAQLGYRMINAGMIEPADLRTGSAGAARMIERTFARWAAEDGAPASVRAIPGNFKIVDPTMDQYLSPLARWDRSVAWLVFAPDRAATRWYVGPTADALVKLGRGDLASHAMATLYAGLDAICYNVKPPEFLRWAQLLWWHGHESDKAAKAAGKSCAGMPTRRTFDNRYPAWSIAPRRHPAAMNRIPRHFRKLAEAIAGVETALRSRHLLRPNVPEFSESLALNHFAVFVRAFAGDYQQRLVHDYFNATDGKKAVDFHGAWPLRTIEDIERARCGIAANTILAGKLEALGYRMGGIAMNSMGGHW